MRWPAALWRFKTSAPTRYPDGRRSQGDSGAAASQQIDAADSAPVQSGCVYPSVSPSQSLLVGRTRGVKPKKGEVS